jgi:hypothetical protein
MRLSFRFHFYWVRDIRRKPLTCFQSGPVAER